MILEQPSVRFEAIHSILSSDGNILTVSELCETAGVSRSGYYRWLSAAGAREKRGRVLVSSYCCSSYRVADPFSSLGTFSSSFITSSGHF